MSPQFLVRWIRDEFGVWRFGVFCSRRRGQLLMILNTPESVVVACHG